MKIASHLDNHTGLMYLLSRADDSSRFYPAYLMLSNTGALVCWHHQNDWFDPSVIEVET